MNTMSLSGSYQLNGKWSIRSGLGLIRGGKLSPNGQASHTVKQGCMLALGAEYLFRQGEGYQPYLEYSIFLSASTAEVENPATQDNTSYFSSDLRLGARASWSIKASLFPYVMARLFGGPVFWELGGVDVTGSDTHHYQIALGTGYRYHSVSIFLEYAGLGEQALSAGISYGF